MEIAQESMRSFALLLLPVLAAAQQQAPAPCLEKTPEERPYTRVRLVDIVRDQTPTRAEYLIRTCGVRVSFSKELEADLREAGAVEKVLAAVRDVAVKIPEPVKPVAPAPFRRMKWTRPVCSLEVCLKLDWFNQSSSKCIKFNLAR